LETDEKTGDLSGGDMKSMLGLVLLIASMFIHHAPNQTMFMPDQMQYGPVPGFLPAGAQLAVLEGDPTASSGDFTVRLKMPAATGFRLIGTLTAKMRR
jgi:hypothetical protein